MLFCWCPLLPRSQVEYLKLSDGRCSLRALQNDCASSCIDGVNGVDARVADTLVGIYRGHHVHTYMLRW
jgi:hypothetical protein